MCNRIAACGLLLVSLCLPLTVWAHETAVPSQVMLTLNADQWVSSDTANVSVAVHAQLTQAQLAHAQENIVQALQKISAQTWHIVQMQHSQSQANLEQLEVLAQARLPNQAIADLRNKAKAVSEQGEQFEIVDIDYSPAEAELNAAQAHLRQRIYRMAQAEINTLNQIDPQQNYYLLTLNFNSPIMPIAPSIYQKMTVAEASVNTAQSPSASPGDGHVSEHIRLSAQVVLGAHNK